MMRLRIQAMLGLLLTLTALAGCGGSSGPAVRSTFIEFDAEQKAVIEQTAGLAYRIQ